MITAKHHIFIYPFFRWLTRFLVQRKFHAVHLIGDNKQTTQPLLVIANHISWWDGFWILYLNMKVLHRRFYFMMLEQQLRRYWYFRYCGGYSIKKNSKSIIESLNYTVELLKNPANMVLLFPQGRIHSLYEEKIKFEKGLSTIIRQTNDIQVVFVTHLVDYAAHPKPSVSIYYKFHTPDDDSLTLEKAYQNFYIHCTESQKIQSH